MPIGVILAAHWAAVAGRTLTSRARTAPHSQPFATAFSHGSGNHPDNSSPKPPANRFGMLNAVPNGVSGASGANMSMIDHS